MKFSIIALFFMSLNAMSQPRPRAEFAQQLYQQHDAHREASIQVRRFKHADIQPLIQRLHGQNGFTVTQLGKSIQGREINLVSVGTGPVPVLLWSQMHGDEATATMAILDIFRFLNQDHSLGTEKREILSKLTLHFIPMLNPDGAEVWTRRNALGIDMNRDAAKLQSPESRILKQVRDSLQPQVGFNLHDQRIHYTAGNSAKPATISFLAPAYDREKSINPVRSRAMKLIAAMSADIAPFIPGGIAKYDDEHEPRAFGDNIQKWGTSTILIESGGYPNDPEKQYIRKINFVAMLSSFLAIARAEESQYNEAQYWAIPENRTLLRPLVLRNVEFKKANKTSLIDIAWDRREKTTEDLRHFYYQSQIDDLGDLNTLHGYTEVDCQGLEVKTGHIYPKYIKLLAQIKELDFKQMLEQGYTAIHYIGNEPLSKEPSPNFPLNILTGPDQRSNQIKIEHNPDLIFRKNGKFVMAVINGFVYQADLPWLGNPVVY